VVWDVDPVAECVRIFRPDSPDQPTVIHRGEVADAEPAAPGWRLALGDLFR
jgi:Uma2 family endonuclease